jgi:hypothetical protein
MSIDPPRPGSLSPERERNSPSRVEPASRGLTPPEADEEAIDQTRRVHDAAREAAVSIEDDLPQGFRIRGASTAKRDQNDPERARITSELEVLRQWAKETEEREELNALRELRLKYTMGDPSALLVFRKGSMAPPKAPTSSASQLPRPDPPQKYAKTNRAEFNRWERDCEGFFLRAPDNFLTEEQKVDFGARYLAENLKTLWRTHCATNLYHDPLWAPTWVGFKTIMLDALGTPAERKQAAYEALKRCKQLPRQSPTDLLDYMRPLWEELGSSHTAELQVLEFVSALLPEIQKDLFLVPNDRRDTIPKAEEQANIISRRRAHRGTQHVEKAQGSHHPGKRGPTKHKQTGSDQEEGTKTPKKSQDGKRGRNEPERPTKGRKWGTKFAKSCWACGEAGHFRNACPKNKDRPKDTPIEKSGNDRGQKS